MTHSAAAVLAMLKKAYTGEMGVIEDLGLRCGFLWRCWYSSCRAVNPDGESLCEKCGVARKP